MAFKWNVFVSEHEHKLYDRKEYLKTFDRSENGSLNIICKCEFGYYTIYLKVLVVETRQEFTFVMKYYDKETECVYDTFEFDNLIESFNIPENLDKFTLVIRLCRCEIDCYFKCCKYTFVMKKNGLIPCDSVNRIVLEEDKVHCFLCLKWIWKNEEVGQFPSNGCLKWDKIKRKVEQFSDKDHFCHIKCLMKEVEWLENVGDFRVELFCKRCYRNFVVEKEQVESNLDPIPENEKCSICLEMLKERVRKLKCNHYFHLDCITKWFERSKQCPYCREHVLYNFNLFKKKYLTN